MPLLQKQSHTHETKEISMYGDTKLRRYEVTANLIVLRIYLPIGPCLFV